MGHRRFFTATAGLGLALALAIPGAAAAHDRGSFVYTETNAATGNAILAYARGHDGRLSPLGTFPTHGRGTGTGLATQGEVILAGGGNWLLAVNAGTNDVSVFRVRDDGRLALTDRAGAQGTDPISLTEHDGLVYVLDAGGAGNIAGFWLDADGMLHRVAGSVRPLSGSATNPAEVAFSTDGRFLVVTERATNAIDTYRVSVGRASAAVTTASAGPVPYGFAFDLRNHPIVSEAANSTLSSYRLGAAGASVVSASVPTGGLAACWVAVTPSGRWAFDANAHGGTISSFAIHSDGSISLAHSIAASTGAGSAPLDLGVTSDGRFLFVLEAGSHGIGGYRIGTGGTLSPASGMPAVPASASGLAVS